MTYNFDDSVPREPTTTHAPWGAGRPRLLVTNEPERFVHDLTDEVTTVGSANTCTLALADTDPLHATITHDDQDEYVLTLHGYGEMNANPHVDLPADGEKSEILRTGAHFTAGPWRLVFQRDEFADHGRPHGGRQGGEGSHQLEQPDRPDYSGQGDEPSSREDQPHPDEV